MYSRFGIDCPGCGLTRSFIHLAHAEPLAAWELNPLSWLLFGYVVAQIPLALAHGAGVRTKWLKNLIGINQWGLVTIMIALVVRWGFKIALGDW